MILDYISLPIFLISLAVGLFVVYILGPEENVMYIYPTPKNVRNMLFKDKTDECFKYISKEVECPADDSLIQTTKVQS
jgi:hypothetical protein